MALERLGLMQKLDIRICPVAESDISQIAKLENMYFSEPWSEISLKKSLNKENYCFICAKTGLKVVAYASMYVVNPEGYICNIVVHEDYRNMGIATNIINKIIQYSQKMNLEILTLEVRESNIKAVNLYKKHDFECVGIRKNFYTNPTENAYIMTRFLNNN